jgi:DNA-binding response OmpR family regulator
MQRILVIDDDPAITSLLKRGLSYEGFTVDIAGTGEAGLALARERPPDLVVLDIMMPGINGLEVLRRLRAADDRLPVLMLTAKDAPADQVLGLEAGADDYVVSRSPSRCCWRACARCCARQQAEHPPVLTFADPHARHRQSYRAARRAQVVLTSLGSSCQTFLEHCSRCSPRRHCSTASGATISVATPTVEVYVKQLRQKLEGHSEPRLLHISAAPATCCARSAMSIRVRLALWYGGLFALVLLLVTVLSYAFHVRGHYDDRDRALITSAGPMASEAGTMPDGPHLLEGRGGLEVGFRLYGPTAHCASKPLVSSRCRRSTRTRF